VKVFVAAKAMIVKDFSSFHLVKNLNPFSLKTIQAEVAERFRMTSAEDVVGLCSRLQSGPTGFNSLPRLSTSGDV